MLAQGNITRRISELKNLTLLERESEEPLLIFKVDSKREKKIKLIVDGGLLEREMQEIKMPCGNRWRVMEVAVQLSSGREKSHQELNGGAVQKILGQCKNMEILRLDRSKYVWCAGKDRESSLHTE